MLYDHINCSGISLYWRNKPCHFKGKKIFKTMEWSQQSEEILQQLKTAKHGLDHEEAQRRLQDIGPNQLIIQNKRSKIWLLITQFKNPMAYTLGVAALIAFILGENLDAAAILSILFINALIGFVQESKSHNAIEALKQLSSPKVRVIRSGQVRLIASEEVVPGDIIQLEAGDYVSADARILEAFQLSANEASLTGEPHPIEKDSNVVNPDADLAERKNMLYSGTAINTGSARAVVIHTGMKTEIGKIASMMDTAEEDKTPLQKKLEIVTRNLIYLGLIVIVIVIGIHLHKGEPWFLIFMSAISLAVAAIPEGLPTVVTLALTFAVRRMTKRNALVRNLSAVEALGSTDVICSDKTGTLTEGVMSAREHFLPDENLRMHFFNDLVLCNNSSLDHGGSGDTTEIALLKYSEQSNFLVSDLNNSYQREHEWSFDSQRKRMSVKVLDKNRSVKFVYVKGAPESILPICNMSEELKEKVSLQISSYATRGLRVLALGYKEEDARTIEEAESKLNFIGLIALADPPRAESKAAIKECQEAGIKVVMITGDHAETARAIASELGILIPGHDLVLTGKELDNLSDEELVRKVDRTAVYARVSPAHKMKIIRALQSNDHIVAMTGDGVNDAPALKASQIGVSMGRGGTEVARQASNIVLTDDNFATIVSAVEEGRSIYGNIRQTIQYLLSTNFAEILIVLGSAFLGLMVPFNPMGLLWINLVTDGLPSLALAAEPLDKNILRTSKRPSPRNFFDKRFIVEMLIMGILMTVIGLGIYVYLINSGDSLKARSYAFTVLVFLCMSRSFSCRSEVKTFFQLKPNYYHLLAVAVTFVLHLSFQNTELFRKVFEVNSLTFIEIIFLFVISLIPSTLIEIYKLIAQKAGKK